MTVRPGLAEADAIGRQPTELLGTTDGLGAAIVAARTARRDPVAAAALCWRLRWDRLFAAELEDLRELAA